MFCQNCGNQIQDNMKFCSNCGVAVMNANTVTQVDSSPMGTITFNRVKCMVGAMVPFKVLVDGKLAGTLKNDSSISVNVPYGVHDIKLSDFWQMNIILTENAPNITVYMNIVMPGQPNIFKIVKTGEDVDISASVCPDLSMNLSTEEGKKRMGLAGLIFAIIGLFILPWAMGVTAIGVGINAQQMSAQEGKNNGAGIAAIIIGIIDIVAYIFLKFMPIK